MTYTRPLDSSIFLAVTGIKCYLISVSRHDSRSSDFTCKRWVIFPFLVVCCFMCMLLFGFHVLFVLAKDIRRMFRAGQGFRDEAFRLPQCA